jgi:hypothetical protein
MHHREAVFPGIGDRRVIQSREEIRRDFGSHKKISDAISDSDAEATFENFRPFDERSQTFGRLSHEMDAARLHDDA